MEFVTAEDGCKHFHPYTCGKQVMAPCPLMCKRKAAFDEYFEVEEAEALRSNYRIQNNAKEIKE